MHTTKKRITAWIMVFAMLFSLLPTTTISAWADETSDVAQVGEQTYDTLGDAISNAPKGATITLLKDYTTSAQALITKNLTLDLNGHKLTVPVGIVVQKSNTLTVKDSVNGTGKLVSSNTNMFGIRADAHLNIESGTFEFAKNFAGNAAENSNANISITGGTFSKSVYSYVPSAYYKVKTNAGWTYFEDWQAAYDYYKNNNGTAIGNIPNGSGPVTVTLDDDNGNVETLNVYTGSKIILPEPAARSNNTFNGWLSSGNKNYSAGATITVPGSKVTFTAQWAGDAHTITYQNFDNNGSGSTVQISHGTTIYLRGTDGQDQDVEVQGNMTLDTAYPQFKARHTFLGWDYTINGTSNVFTARWAENIDLGSVESGDQGAGVTRSVTAGGPYIFSGNTHFEVTDQDSNTINIKPKTTLAAGGTYTDTIVVSNSAGFVAAYQVSVAVTTHGMSPEFSSALQALTVGKTDQIKLTENSVPANATITYESSDTDVATVTAEGLVTAVSAGTTTITVTIMATNYETKTLSYDLTVSNQVFTVTFNGSNKTSGDLPVSQSVASGGTVASPGATNLTKTGYDLVGWSATGSAEDLWIFGDEGTPVTGDTTLYAVWAVKQYAINYDQHNDGSATTSATVNVAHGSTIYLNLNGGTLSNFGTPDGHGRNAVGPVEKTYTIPAPTWDGYVFDGWTVNSDGTVFSAQWKDAEYTVYFDADGGTMDGTDNGTLVTTAIYGTAFSIPLPTKDGYTFDGWYVDSIRSSFFSENAGKSPIYNLTAGYNLKAKWTQDQYDVTFVYNNGTDGSSTRENMYTYGQTVEDLSNPPAYDGHYLVGWYTTQDFQEGTQFIFDQTQITSDLTLYAKWSTNAYALTFDKYTDKGIDPNGSVSVEHGTTINFVLDGGQLGGMPERWEYLVNGPADKFQNPTKTGYDFAGWDYNEGNQTFTAVWDANQYKVSFNLDGGEYDDDLPTSVTYGQPFTFPGEPTKTGYTFGGWLVGDTESVIAAGTELAQWTWTNGMTYKAKWNESRYGVTLVVGEEKISYYAADSEQYHLTYGDKIPDPSGNSDVVARISAATPEGQTITGWYTLDEKGEETAWNFGEDTVTGDTVLYADLETQTFALSYTGYDSEKQSAVPHDKTTVDYGTIVYFNYDGGHNPSNSDETSLAPITVKEAIQLGNLEKDGYDFLGWNKTENPGGSMTFTAMWGAKTYSLTFDEKYEGGKVDEQSVAYGSKVTVPTPTRDGYTFGGWYGRNDNQTSAEPTYKGGETITYTANYDSYYVAKWVEAKYGVTLVVNGQEIEYYSATDDEYYLTYNKLIPSDPTSDPRVTALLEEGTEIEGWYTSDPNVNAQSDETSEPQKWDFAKDTVKEELTLYAKIVPIEYTITFDAGDGYIDKDAGTHRTTRTATVGSTITDIPQPQREGYTFGGWQNGSKAIVFDAGVENGEWSWATDDTLTAKWNQITYTVTYHINGQTKTYDNVAHGTVISGLGTNGYLIEGQTFVGWYTSDPDSPDAEQWKMGTDAVTSNLNLYAKIETTMYDLEYTAGFDAQGREDKQTAKIPHGQEIAIDAVGGQVEGWPDNTPIITKDEVLPDATKTGFTFLGWEYDEKNYVFTAQWKEQTREVTLDANGGTFDEKQKTLTVNASHDGIISPDDGVYQEPTRDGYTFKGWAWDENGEYPFTLENGRVTKEGVTLYAQWEEITYTIIYDGNGGTVKADDETDVTQYYRKIKDTTGQTFEDNYFVNPGYTFVGWSEEPDSKNIWDENKKIIKPRNMTLYARWEPTSYTVTFDAKGGTMAEGADQVSVNYQETFTFPEVTKDGYDLDGWKLTTGKALYPAGDQATFTATDNLVYEAQWAAKTYTWTYWRCNENDPGTDKLLDASLTVKYGDQVVIDPNGGIFNGSNRKLPVTVTGGMDVVNPVKDGSGFLGWERIGDAATGYTLKARWKETTYTITYYGNGGATAEGNWEHTQTLTTAANQKFDANPFTKAGYTFTGWTFAQNGSGSLLADEKVIKTPRDMELYAQWKPATYTVTFDANGGTLEAESNKVEVTYQGALTFPKVSRAGYGLIGWNIAGSSEVYQPGKEISYGATSNLTYVALWDETTYTITYHGNGGAAWDAGSESHVSSYTQKINTASGQRFDQNRFERTGYTFAGWTLKADGSGSLLSDQKGISKPRDMDLYAQWTANEYTLTLDANGGTVLDASGSAVEERTYTVTTDSLITLPEPTREGYTFVKWHVSDGSAGYEAKQEITYNFAQNVRLVAEWEADDQTVRYTRYNVEDASQPDRDASVTVAYGTEIIIRPNGGQYLDDVNLIDGTVNTDREKSITVTKTTYLADPVREGWKFMGWYYDTSAHAFTAQWQQIKYTITFYGNGGIYKPGEGNLTAYPQELTAEAGQTLQANLFVREGYHFIGWSEAANSTENLIADGKEISTPRSMELYAQWERNDYTAKYDKFVQGGSPVASTETFKYEDVVYVDPNGGTYADKTERFHHDVTGDFKVGSDATKVGSTFNGWIYDESSRTFIAQWITKTYDVTYNRYVEGKDMQQTTLTFNHGDLVYIDPNGGKVGDNTARYDYTITENTQFIDATNDDPSKVFNGWLYVEADRTFVAQWKDKQYTVTFDANGGTFSNSQTEYTVSTAGNTAVTFPTDVTREGGYQLLGWSTTQNGALEYDITKVSKLDAVDSGTTLYAVWAQIVDFGNVAYGNTKVETLTYLAALDINNVSSQTEAFCLQAEGADLKINPEESLTPGTYEDMITVRVADQVFYVQAKVNVTMGDVNIGVTPAESYIVGETLTVYVNAAPNQTLTMSVSGENSDALRQNLPLTEIAASPGTYYAVYEVTSIPADEVNLTFSVLSGDSTLASTSATLQLRTLLNVTVLDSDGEPTSLQEITLKDSGDTSKSLAIPYVDNGVYTTRVDKASGWDYVHIVTGDGREVNLDTTTTGNTLTYALKQSSPGVVNVAFNFSEYKVAGTLYYNGVKQEIPPVSVTGDYGDTINIDDLKQQAINWAQEAYDGADADSLNPVITNTDGTAFTITTYGSPAAVWDSTNTVYVNVNVTIGYNVKFDKNDGGTDTVQNIPANQFVERNGAATKPADPTRKGYVFGGWYIDQECTTLYDFAAAVTENITLWAKWDVATYTVTFNTNYGVDYGPDTAWAPQTVAYGGYANDPGSPTRDGYTFKGWKTANENGWTWDFTNNNILAPTTLYAQWEAIEYKVQFDLHLNEGEGIPGYGPVTGLIYNDLYQQPADPVRKGYVFQGWYLDAGYTQAATFPMTVTGDIVLHAKWGQEATVTFYTLVENSVAQASYSIQVAIGEPIPAQEAPVRYGYEFTGWYTNEACTTPWEAETAVTGDTYLYAGWQAMSGHAEFINMTATDTYVRIRLVGSQGNTVPANGITDLTLKAVNNTTGSDIFNNVHMREIAPGDARWQAGWDNSQYAYYYGTYPSLAGKGQFTLILDATGYSFETRS